MVLEGDNKFVVSLASNKLSLSLYSEAERSEAERSGAGSGTGLGVSGCTVVEKISLISR